MTIPMPGALRWREMYPLVEGDGSCGLIYDLERAAVLEVPEELRFYVAPALEAGDLDDGLLSWLVQEDLLTAENPPGANGGESAGFQAGRWNLGAVHRVDDQVFAELGPRTESEIAGAIEPVFKQSLGASRVELCFSWPEGVPDVEVVRQLLVEAGRLAVAHQQIGFQLALDVRQVEPVLSTCLAGIPLRVKVRCAPFPARGGAAELRRWETSAASVLLLAPLRERVTVSCELPGGARLLDLWDWAKRLRLCHLDADRLPGGSLREYRNDLRLVCNEMASELEARRSPIDYQPVTRIVRRLMGTEPGGRAASSAFAWAAGSEPYPGLEGLPPEAREGKDDPCPRCWARKVCNHSSFLTPASAGESPAPTGERCALWLAEAEAALRLYHRLAHCDPIDVVHFIEAPGQLPFDPIRRDEAEDAKLPC
ncbi:MAG TPA: hypothetical protein DD490_07925 [Acidobacteria bacterium]|nr:hypothetical protein [Acidobacteriota bacterium]